MVEITSRRHTTTDDHGALPYGLGQGVSVVPAEAEGPAASAGVAHGVVLSVADLVGGAEGIGLAGLSLG
ncbi:hypothetical protein, partial [Streptomyces sp. MB09-02B]|uniref:hypothetical protein n=1 Tax=Streptomyces sp. MB09-02B TaxID=3028667 RepID=UPI0029AD2552